MVLDPYEMPFEEQTEKMKTALTALDEASEAPADQSMQIAHASSGIEAVRSVVSVKLEPLVRSRFTAELDAATRAANRRIRSTPSSSFEGALGFLSSHMDTLDRVSSRSRTAYATLEVTLRSGLDGMFEGAQVGDHLGVRRNVVQTLLAITGAAEKKYA